MPPRASPLLITLLTLGPSACGGRTEGETDPPFEAEASGDPQPEGSDLEPPSEPPPEGKDEMPSGLGTFGDAPVPPPPAGETPLEACVEGSFPSQNAPCPWIGDGFCYPTKVAACNCLCPMQGSTVCLSGLPGGEYGRVEVTCL